MSRRRGGDRPVEPRPLPESVGDDCQETLQPRHQNLQADPHINQGGERVHASSQRSSGIQVVGEGEDDSI